VAAAGRGTGPDELTDAFQAEHTYAAAELAGDPATATVTVTEEMLRETLAHAELGNGLEPDENDELMDTADLDVIVALVLARPRAPGMMSLVDDRPGATSFGRCPCGGQYDARTVQVQITVDGEQFLLDDVPQGACPSCGSRVYKAYVLEELEAMHRGRPARSLRVPTGEPPAGR
jgi:YgiT-type zinc finger domain-containing protein